MYKTIWYIDDEDYRIELTWYHFGKKPKFPTCYMLKGIIYEIEMLWNLKLIFTLKTFFKCLFHKCTIENLGEGDIKNDVCKF